MSKRERLTERQLPHRKEVTGGGAGPEGINNPVVMIALGGFVLALVLAVAVVIGRGLSEGSPEAATGAGAATPPPAEAAGLRDTTPAGDTGDHTGGAPEAAPGNPGGDTVGQKKQYSAPEDQGLDGEANAYFATIDTNKGRIVAELWPSLAPQTVNSFVFLARDGFFDGLKFHRVVPGFVIQGGDPQGNGQGGPGYSLPAEFNDVPHVPGILSMARTDDPNSAGSQFFIVLPPDPASSLDNQYTVFGYTVEGMDVVQSIAVGDVMEKVTIEEKPAADSRVSPDDVRSGTLP